MAVWPDSLIFRGGLGFVNASWSSGWRSLALPLDNQEERSVPLDDPEEAGEWDVHIAKSGERNASAFR